jgi:hypothetical protein
MDDEDDVAPMPPERPVLVPEIDENVPLPKSAAEALPELTPAEELQMRARTIKLISDITNMPIMPTEDDRQGAIELAREMMSDPSKRPDYSRYPNEQMAYLAGLVTQSNCQLVDELSELKNYVINKLIYEVEHATSAKERISALTKLGEVDGVDAFKKRSEMTVQIKPIEEVEKELMTVLEGIEYRVVGEKSVATDA